VTGRAEWLVVGGPAGPWERLGLTVIDGTVPLFGTGLRIDPDAAPGIVGWQPSSRRPARRSSTTRRAPSGSITSS
jgi:hypothetical protein